MALHVSGPEIEDFVAGEFTSHQATTVAHAVDTGVVHPANAAYTQADQTALAAAVQSNTTQLNAVIDALKTAGLMA